MISICGIFSSDVSSVSEGVIITSSSFSRELMISFARDAREFWNLVSSLNVRNKKVIASLIYLIRAFDFFSHKA